MQNLPFRTLQSLKMGIVLKEPAEMFEINFVIFFLILGGAKGPGIFFIIPCTDSYQKVDLRTVSFDVPPQEVSYGNLKMPFIFAKMSQISIFNLSSV